MVSIAGQGAAAGAAGGYSGYSIDNCAVLDGSSNYFSWTPGSAGNRKTWSFSCVVKRAGLGSAQTIFSGGTGTTVQYFGFDASDKFEVYISNSAKLLSSTRVFRDVGSSYHVFVVQDTTESGGASDRFRVLINGVEITAWDTDARSTYMGLNDDEYINQAQAHMVGRYSPSAANYFDGYLSDIYFIDGTAHAATDFGEFYNGGDAWRLIDPSGLSYGTNGFHLDFADGGALGDDESGNANDWTVNGSPVQSGDSPTTNYCTWNVLKPTIHPLTDGNRTIDCGAAYYHHVGTIGIEPGEDKYFEIEWNGYTGGSGYGWCGVGTEDIVGDYSSTETPAGTYGLSNIGTKTEDGSETASHFSWSTAPDGTVYGFQVDRINNVLKVYKDGTYESGKDLTIPSGGTLFPWGNAYSPVDLTIDCGQAGFQYTQPADTTEIKASAIPEATGAALDPSAHFNALLHTGTGAELAVTGANHQPGLVITKNRDQADSHIWCDEVRGATEVVHSNEAAAEVTEAQTIKSFDSDGFTLGTDVQVNTNTEDYVSWCLKGSGTSGSSNTDGSITSTVSVNDDAGFSIVSYTGTGSNATAGHGQSAAPEMIICKNRTDAVAWCAYHSGVATDPETDYLVLNGTGAAADDSTLWNDIAPTSSIFSVGSSNNVNGLTDDIIAYCFRSIHGYSKVFSYEGNSSADGAFVYLGFKPRFLLVKNIDSAQSWHLRDSETTEYNPSETSLFPNLSNAEITNSGYHIDFLCNGFKSRANNAAHNQNTIVGIAFAENPFGGSNVPLALAA